MSYKKIVFKKKAKSNIIDGINILANAVKITLGPRGKNVIINKRFNSPFVTKDGVTVAKEITLENNLKNIGAQMLREVASKTNDDAGDGTTTATVLAQAIINESSKYIAIGIEPILIKKQIEKYLKIITKRLLSTSKKINTRLEISQVGSISSNNDLEIGNMISKAMYKIGKNGVISVEEGKLNFDQLDVVKGMQIDKGYMSSYFLNSNEDSILLEDCLILIYEKKLKNFRNIYPILEKISKIGKPLLIIADDYENEIITTLILNNARGIIKVIPIKSPSFGEKKISILEDISILTGTKVINLENESILKKIKINELGKSKKIEIKKDTTTIIKGNGCKKLIKKRINMLKMKLKNTDSEYDIEKLKERISKLSGGIALIKVGGLTETEMKERKYRIEDALNATKAALENGIVPGGGIALIRVSEWMKKNIKKSKQNIGFNILVKSIQSPFKQIMKNGGREPGVILSKLKNKYYEYGYDLSEGKFCNLVKNGVIDPTKVVIHAIQNAVSISNLIITSECVIYQKKNKKNNFNKELENL
ncbi:chaperonin GroEL [Candidatus Vidania fulgoroideorum]